MDWLTPDLLKSAGPVLGACMAVYGGIRADLGRMAARIAAAHDLARSAHDRIDRHLEGHHE